MTIPFRIDIELDDQVSAALERLIGAGEDMSPVMRDISEILLDQTMENFEQEGRPEWQVLAPSTVAERSKHGWWPGKILQRSGQLRSAIAPFSGPLEAGVSVAMPYGAIHQLGGFAGRGGAAAIPARPYLPVEAGTDDQLQAEAEDSIINAFNKYLLESWEG